MFQTAELEDARVDCILSRIYLILFKGQLISKANCQAVDSPKKRMNGV